MNTRRKIIIALGAGLLIVGRAAHAQQALVGCNSREAYCTEQVRDDELNSLVGYGVARNPPYKNKKVIE